MHCRVETEGRKSDIKVFRETPVEIDKKVKLKGDLGYKGIDKKHANSKVPHKKPKDGELTERQKKQNKSFRKVRVKVEHVIRNCKCFRVVKETYRNRLRHIGEVWLIICGLVNANI